MKKLYFILLGILALGLLTIILFALQKKTESQQTPNTTTGDYFFQAQMNSTQANEAFVRANKVLSARMQVITPQYLFPKKIKNRFMPWDKEHRLWNNKDVASDLYGFLVLGSYFTDNNFLPLLKKTLDSEASFSQNGLPVSVDITNGTIIKEDIDAVIFGASEYAKDGLLPIAELIGKTAWYERMLAIENGLFQQNRVKTAYGFIPSNGVEANGVQLQTLPRLYLATHDKKYLEWAERIGDNYIYDILPNNNYEPCEQWNFTTKTCDSPRVRLRDHGNEIIPGLVELYSVEKTLHSPRQAVYKQTIEKMLDQLLVYRNDDGFFYVDNMSKKELTDNWGYVYYGYYLYYLLENKTSYYTEIVKTLQNITTYDDYARGGGSMDGLADTIEGALYFLNITPQNQNAKAFIETSIRRMFARQKENGFVDAMYLDGNFIRTALMYGLYKTQGVYMDTFDSSVALGAYTNDDILYLYVSSPKPQNISLKFDYARHQAIMHMPYNYPRINAFPEWYTIKKDAKYRITFVGEHSSKIVSGNDLINGISVSLTKAKKIRIEKE